MNETTPPNVLNTKLRINGSPYSLATSPNAILADVLREELNFTSVKVACDQGACGACTVLIDGMPAIACTMFVFEAGAKDVTTIEGLCEIGVLHAVQKAFLNSYAFQCGFCTPGMILSVVAMLKVNSTPDREFVRKWIGAHICRCTGYNAIIEAAMSAAASLEERRDVK